MFKSTLNIPYFSIRLLTLLSYFLPFVFFLSTCTSDSVSKDAYNKDDALKNEYEKSNNSIHGIYAIIDSINPNNSEIEFENLRSQINMVYLNSSNIIYLKEELKTKIIFPTNYSLSGIGSILIYKNTIGKIAIGISIALSFLTFVFWLLINKRRLGIYFIIGNMMMILIFVIDSFLSNIDLLYGVWVLLFLLIVQLLTEIKNPKNTNSTVNDAV
jgi:hypothetical protein